VEARPARELAATVGDLRPSEAEGGGGARRRPVERAVRGCKRRWRRPTRPKLVSLMHLFCPDDHGRDEMADVGLGHGRRTGESLPMGRCRRSAAAGQVDGGGRRRVR
jgi:hypothetical protein